MDETNENPFYDMFLNMWILGSVTAASLLRRVPKFISQEEYETIISHPQDGIIPLAREEQE